DHDLPARARHIGEVATARFAELAQRVPAIGEVRGRGAMLALEFVRPGTTEPDAALTAAIAKRCLEQGVITLTCGTYGNVIRLLPPLVITDELLDDALTVLCTAIAELAANPV
ncbi:aminotransferase class III-fold pyridoxal phosphate-dependent enzyme, partial [Nocardia sp. NPDC004722]